jgi:hypothetical protein
MEPRRRMSQSAERDAWTKFVEGKSSSSETEDSSREKSSENQYGPARTMALGRLKVGERNKTEAAYEAHLNLRKIIGEVAWFEFEGMTFRLADNTRYTPDFNVMLTNGMLECHEVKGTTKREKANGEIAYDPFFLDDAKVKIKVAAAQYPIVFKIVHKVQGNWTEREV